MKTRTKKQILKSAGTLKESYSLNQLKVKINRQGGITLVALVVTIVVLLILAGITIMYVMGDNGVFGKAQEAKERTEQAKQDEQEYIGNLGNDIDNYLNGNGGGAGPDVPKGPNGKPLVSNVTNTNHKTTKVEDKYGNEITVPEGFKVVEGSAGEEITVQNGVVIEDSAENQFVWIPVGEVTLNDGTTKKEIKLGRYTFDTTTGNPTMEANSYQYAYTEGNLTNYTNTVTIGACQELSTARDGVASRGTDGLNATAKNLAGFVDSVRINGGYYLARYEASYGSGYNSSGSTDNAKYGNAKPLSKPSTATTFNVSTPTSGSLWNKITQLNAVKVARNMYVGNKDINGKDVGVESDLVNSYAWDTAIVYITEMGNTNFANKKRDNVGGVTDIANTGSNSSDKFCNVYDMVANEWEWTTEYSTSMGSSGSVPCVYRGGSYGSFYYTAGRYQNGAMDRDGNVSFRLSLYIK